MSNDSFTMQGLDGFRQLLTRLVPTVRDEIKAITEETGQAIVSDAKSNAPVDTGLLKASIRYEIVRGGFGVKIVCGVPYWAWVEYGTGTMVSIPPGFEELASQYKGKGIRKVNRAAQPFLIPAWLKNQAIYYERIKGVLPRLLR